MDDIKTKIIESFRDQVGKAFDDMSKKDLELLESLATDAAELHAQKLLGKDVAVEIQFVNASLINFSIAKYFPIKKIFWRSVERAATLILTALVRAALSAV